jgi:hypothetical protein
MNCPKCKGDLKPDDYSLSRWEMGNDALLNCLHCNDLLIIRDGELHNLCEQNQENDNEKSK